MVGLDRLADAPDEHVAPVIVTAAPGNVVQTFRNDSGGWESPTSSVPESDCHYGEVWSPPSNPRILTLDPFRRSHYSHPARLS